MYEDSESPFVEGEFHIRSRVKRLRCSYPEHQPRPSGCELKDPFEEYHVDEIPPRPKRSRAKPNRVPISLPEIHIPENVLSTDTDDDESGSEGTSSPQLSDVELPGPAIDDLNVFDSDTADDIPTLKLDEGPILYPGASVTMDQAVYMLLSWFSTYPGISKSALDRLLHILHNFILPTANNLPTSYSNLMKRVQPFLSVVKDYHCCVNDCIIFRDSDKGEYANASRCPECDEERYEPGTKIPRKRFKYLPLETRIRRIYADKAMSQLLQSHGSTETNAGIVSDIHQTKTWKTWYSPSGIFEGDTRGLSFAICMDGFNPFSRDKVSYSTCPIFLEVLNLPQHLRRLPGSVMLTGLISGPREPKNTDPYVDVLVDDILHLNTLVVYDGYKEETFTLKSYVLLNIFDYVGQNKVLHCQGAGAYSGCAYCCIQGEYSKVLQKMVYLEHRSFLPNVDRLHVEHKHFPKKSVPDGPPLPKTADYVKDKIQRLSEPLSAQERKELIQSCGCTGDYSLSRLPSHDRYLSTPVEPMHLLKNVAERIVKLLSGLTDTVKVRQDEKERKRFRTSWVREENERAIIPKAPFSFTKEEVLVGNERSMCVRAPKGIDWRPCKLFGRQASGLNSNQWKHVLSSGILKFCIRGLIGKLQESTLMELCDVISLLCSEEVDIAGLDALEYRLHRVLSLMERDFPATVHVITLHLLHHLPMYIRRFGPVYSFWMFPMERFNNWIKSRVQNRRYPESNVVETYRIYEVCFHLQITEQLPKGATIDISAGADHDVALTRSSQEEVDVDEEERNTYDHANHSNTAFTLCPEQVEELGKLYMSTYPERRDSGTIRPSESVALYKVYSLRDSLNRLVWFGSELSEHANSVRRSSYVGLLSQRHTFGRIKFIFTHNFDNRRHILACVHWYADSITDHTSGLVCVDQRTINKRISSIVFLTDISKPLVHALDDCDKEKLWILNRI